MIYIYIRSDNIGSKILYIQTNLRFKDKQKKKYFEINLSKNLIIIIRLEIYKIKLM